MSSKERCIKKIFATTTLLQSVNSMYPKKVDTQADHRMVLDSFAPTVAIEGTHRYHMPLHFLDDCNVVSDFPRRLEQLPIHIESWETAHRIFSREASASPPIVFDPQ